MWTDNQVQAFGVEATDTLRRLPDHNPLYGSGTWWPEIRKFPQEDWPPPAHASAGPPGTIHIDRYLETLEWLQFINTKNPKRDRDLVFAAWFCQYGKPVKYIKNWDQIRAKSRTKLPNSNRWCRTLYSNAISIICGNLTARDFSLAQRSNMGQNHQIKPSVYS